MNLTVFRRTKLQMLIDQHDSSCHYCKRAVKLRVSSSQHNADDATLDHKLAKSKGGTNADDNLLLSCRACNEAKEDRSYDDFLARPYRVKAGKPVKARKITQRRPPYRPPPPGGKTPAWSLAAAIERGEVAPHGVYRKAPMDVKLKASKPARKMTAIETAQFLRESATQRGRAWPLA